MFSPYYYWAGRRDPENHCAVNVGLYGDGWSRWTMTERPRCAVARADDGFAVRDSGVFWDGDALTVTLNEISVPHLTRIRGTVRLIPDATLPQVYGLDAPGRHFWRPVAPSARIEVALERPALSWSGAGYFDMNWGTEPLEDGFSRWDWSRAPLKKGAAVLYDATRRDGSDLSLALRFDGQGGVEPFDPPPRAPLKKTLWRVDRRTQADPGATPEVVRAYEDAPFYARAELKTRLLGEDAAAMHETLDLNRFATRWVKLLLPWRMPRSPS